MTSELLPSAANGYASLSSASIMSEIIPGASSTSTMDSTFSILAGQSANVTESTSAFSSLTQITLTTFKWTPHVLYWIITFTSITLPTWLFTLFSTRLTFTVNFTTLLLLGLVIISAMSWVIRYRFLNVYSRLPPEPQRKEEHIDLFPDTHEGDSKPGLATYLDEILTAIKVFGYLDRDIFAELTRTMQTRKLIAGETLFLEEEKGFCLVVDGLVQIFVKSSREPDPLYDDSRADGDSEDSQEAGSQGYQLLTEVKNGAPMSSLFSILSLFTEDIKLRHQDSEENRVSPTGQGGEKNQSFQDDYDARGLQTPETNPSSPTQGLENPFQARVPQDRRPNGTDESLYPSKLPAVPPLSLESQNTRKRPSLAPSIPKQKNSFHPDILARATVDTTIAIIPATAFRRLTRVYPKAIAHIVQVILTRLQRVTLATGHSYLGLTSEVLRTEKHMNRYTTYELPKILQGGALERLKEKFQKERERIGPEEGMKGIALHNGRSKARRRVSRSSLKQDMKTNGELNSEVTGRAAGTPGLARQKTNGLPIDGGAGVSPGDLLTSVTVSHTGAGANHPSFPIGSTPFNQPFQGPTGIEMQSPLAQRSFKPFAVPQRANLRLHRQESLDEDSILRGSILECMFKAIGLQDTSTSFQKAASVEHSPRMVSYDSMRQKAVFTHAFGLMNNQSEGSADGDSDSAASMPVSNASFGGAFSRTGLIDELRDDVEIVYFPKDSVLVEQGERNPGLYFLIDGFLDVSTPAEEGSANDSVLGSGYGSSVTEDFSFRSSKSNSKNSQSSFRQKRRQSGRQNLFLIKPGGIAGYIGTISSYRSFIDVRAKTDVYVGFLPRTALERIVEKYPVVLLTMAKRMTSLLPRLILHIDFALEWVQVNAGQVIYHQNDDSDAIYIVLNGRLRALFKAENDEMRVVGEYGQGESVGELEVLTESSRPATLHAIRDTELAKFPKTLFNSLALEHPGITIKISKIIASRMRALIENPLLEHGKERSATAASKNITSTLNMRTVAILPVTAGVPVVEFGSRLMNALTQVGATNGVTSLNQAAILNHLGRHAFSRMGKLKLSQYLADLEEAYGLVLYVADTNVNAPWTQTCISQADCILLVGLAEDSPSIGEYERFLLGMKTTARKELVLLHLDRYVPAGLTRNWLKNRMWINGGHHHIQMEFRTSTGPVNPQAKRFGSALISFALKQRVQVLQAEIQKYTSRKVRQMPLYSSETPFKGDFHRLARRLCGKSVGLVLGGGGARGISHVGIIRALEEAGLPIDIIGGTSIGAFIGALYARNAGVVPMYGRAKKFAGRMASMWRFALDLTYPSYVLGCKIETVRALKKNRASYTTGHEFNRGIFKAFGNSQIEDFWLEFYCNTTNISKSRSEIHTSGYVWRYVRASMSLAGLLPPLCDEGSMLLDGGYIDNLTVAHMKSLGADVIFAIDVGSLDDNQPQAFGDSLSGFWAFMNRWNPFSSYPNPPTLSEIQARLAYVSSVDALERAKTTPGCYYMRPPIDAYGTLDFGKFDEIHNVGYEFGKEYLSKLRLDGSLPVMEETEEKKKLRRTLAPRRASI